MKYEVFQECSPQSYTAEGVIEATFKKGVLADASPDEVYLLENVLIPNGLAARAVPEEASAKASVAEKAVK